MVDVDMYDGFVLQPDNWWGNSNNVDVGDGLKIRYGNSPAIICITIETIDTSTRRVSATYDSPDPYGRVYKKRKGFSMNRIYIMDHVRFSSTNNPSDHSIPDNFSSISQQGSSNVKQPRMTMHLHEYDSNSGRSDTSSSASSFVTDSGSNYSASSYSSGMRTPYPRYF
ncbi:hypothetical protein BJ085DRAFT_30091 [Dimargaris cristalligena]|uniref:Uncharacterized protein n=1 Tax=Dimargaris cristalligena TaxID=215637 RepID=A0A4P9ZTA3_9FUNG|nr:hypothetical protein BJ085DRAFT_30091 [Dimargaris cristalligena]|eukprot:RKP36816.1 hypothetical protein BJ085DRAFT_30091 [Dimargaris cristalligena]